MPLDQNKPPITLTEKEYLAAMRQAYANGVEDGVSHQPKSLEQIRTLWSESRTRDDADLFIRETRKS